MTLSEAIKKVDSFALDPRLTPSMRLSVILPLLDLLFATIDEESAMEKDGETDYRRRISCEWLASILLVHALQARNLQIQEPKGPTKKES
jgi:hypothetical protein